jgi:ABC-type uncharacterized transport system substrate-binding protein
LAHSEIKSKNKHIKKIFQKREDNSRNQHELMVYQVDKFTLTVITLGVTSFFLTMNTATAEILQR